MLLLPLGILKKLELIGLSVFPSPADDACGAGVCIGGARVGVLNYLALADGRNEELKIGGVHDVGIWGWGWVEGSGFDALNLADGVDARVILCRFFRLPHQQPLRAIGSVGVPFVR